MLASVGAHVLDGVAQSAQSLEVIGPCQWLKQAWSWGHAALCFCSETSSHLIRRYETLIIWCHTQLLLFVKNVFYEHRLSHSETWSQVTLFWDWVWRLHILMAREQCKLSLCSCSLTLGSLADYLSQDVLIDLFLLQLLLEVHEIGLSEIMDGLVILGCLG